MPSDSPVFTLSQPVRLGAWGGITHWRGWLSPQGEEAQEVFVKELSSTDPELQRRFKQEGDVAQRLHHVGVTRLVARSATQLAFAWIPGQSLRQWLDQHFLLSAPEGLLLLREVLGTLQYIHAQGVVHHDLKPENVMLPVEWPQVAQPVILVDFGMAYDHFQPQDVHAGLRMGTPQFMPPEQFMGLRGDPRSDLYAAGALLFDALTGEPPYCNALGWLAGYDLRRAAMPAPASLHPLLEAALQRDPTQRQSAEQMLEMLAQIPV